MICSRFSLLLSVSLFSVFLMSVEAWMTRTTTSLTKETMQKACQPNGATNVASRRHFVTTTTTTSALVAVVVAALTPQTAHAAKKGPPPMSAQEAAAAVQYELQDSQGAVAQLQAALHADDYTTIMELTKTMDQSLRKRVVGQAKYYFLVDNVGTQLSNNVTFDLIGMNRNARPGQENAVGIQQYLDDLQADLRKVLEYTQQAVEAASASAASQ